MKLNAQEDIEAPIDAVWQTLTDFEHWERTVLRRGSDVTRTDRLPEPGPGMSWRLTFPYRGKVRSFDARLVSLTPKQAMAFEGQGQLFDGTLTLDLVDLGPRRTRLAIKAEILPRTLVARLFLQSLRLARGRVERSFKARTGQLAEMIAARNRPAMPRR